MKFQKTVCPSLFLFLFILMTGIAPLFPISAFSADPKPTSVVSTAVKPDAALEMLKKGNERFLSGNIRKEGQAKEDIERLSKGQSPHSIILSCSDSRVPPELVFDQKLGEIFTVRSAGETLSPSAIGSMEFAVEKLGSRLLVVLGHTHCGAVKAAVDTIKGGTAGSENLDQLVSDIHPRIQKFCEGKSPSANLKEESLLNAKGVAKDLLTRSKILSDAVHSGKIKIKVAIYNLENGKVEFQ